MPQTTVGINTWVACRNAEVFAPDPDAFRPERWLEANSKELEHMDRYYIPVRQPLQSISEIYNAGRSHEAFYLPKSSLA